MLRIVDDPAHPGYTLLCCGIFRKEHTMEIKYPILGIDVSKAKLDGCLLDAQGNHASVQVKNTAAGLKVLAHWLERQAVTDLTVCLEATNVYGAAVALFFHERHQRVILANPTAVHAFMRAKMQRAKTDKADAALIAQYARAMAETLRPWHPLPASYDELRDLVRLLQDLTRCRARAKNRREKLAYLTIHANHLHLAIGGICGGIHREYAGRGGCAAVFGGAGSRESFLLVEQPRRSAGWGV